LACWTAIVLRRRPRIANGKRNKNVRILCHLGLGGTRLPVSKESNEARIFHWARNCGSHRSKRRGNDRRWCGTTRSICATTVFFTGPTISGCRAAQTPVRTNPVPNLPISACTAIDTVGRGSAAISPFGTAIAIQTKSISNNTATTVRASGGRRSITGAAR